MDGNGHRSCKDAFDSLQPDLQFMRALLAKLAAITPGLSKVTKMNSGVDIHSPHSSNKKHFFRFTSELYFC